MRMSVLIILAAVVLMSSSVFAAVTAADSSVPIDQLELMVKPLTRDELATEADAWLNLLRRKVQQVTTHEIEVKRKTAEIRAAEEIVDAAKEAKDAVEEAKSSGDRETLQNAQEKTDMVEQKIEESAQVVDRSVSDTAALDAVAGKAGEVIDVKEEHKSEVLDELADLRTARAALISRLNVVLVELESKGGDVEIYRQYADAVADVTLDVTDTTSAWASVEGWWFSEEGGQRVSKNLALGATVLLGFWLLSVGAGWFTDRLTRRSGATSQLLQKFLVTMVRRLILLVGFVLALAAVEVNVTPLMAAIGGAAFIIAFALQGTLSNFASGVLILAYRPFDVDDVVAAGGVEGKVDSMNLVSTHIRTFDNKLMIVPNKSIWEGVITNATGTERRRVDLVFGIGYGDDIGKAREIMENILKEHELVLEEPAPVIEVHELGDSSVNFICRPWVKTDNYWPVYWSITRAVKEAFDRGGISIPFPQRDVHVYNALPADSR